MVRIEQVLVDQRRLSLRRVPADAEIKSIIALCVLTGKPVDLPEEPIERDGSPAASSKSKAPYVLSSIRFSKGRGIINRVDSVKGVPGSRLVRFEY